MPVTEGGFDLDDYIDYLAGILRHLAADGGPVHTLGVCQASVPLICAIASLEAANDPGIPESMVLMGGPIDPRVNVTAVNRLAEERGIEWFRRHCIHTVPFPNTGMGRRVYPGFLQLSGFMAMNIERHVSAQFDMFNHLVEGDGDSAEKHRDFYDEYLAVMDLTAEFYLQTVERVFVRHEVPLGLLRHRGQLIDLSAIRRTALLTVEGEKDDISASARPMPRMISARTFRRSARRIICRSASAITASSTAAASAPKSRAADQGLHAGSGARDGVRSEIANSE